MGEGRYSAEISMWVVDSTGTHHALSHVGTESVVVNGDVRLGPATVFVDVDGEVVERRVMVTRCEGGVAFTEGQPCES